MVFPIAPLQDILPKVTISPFNAPDLFVLSVTVTVAVDEYSAEVVIEGAHKLDDDTKVTIGDFGTFNLTTSDLSYEETATTLHLHRSLFSSEITNMIIENWERLWSVLWTSQKANGIGVLRRLDSILHDDPLGADEEWVEDGVRLRDAIKDDLSDTINRGTQDVGLIVDVLLAYQIGLIIDTSGETVDVQLQDFFKPDAGILLAGITKPTVSIDHRDWLNIPIGAQYLTATETEIYNSAGTDPKLWIDQVSENAQYAQLEVALQRIRGVVNKISVTMPLISRTTADDIPVPLYAIYTMPDSIDVIGGLKFMVVGVEYTYPRGSAPTIEVECINAPSEDALSGMVDLPALSN